MPDANVLSQRKPTAFAQEAMQAITGFIERTKSEILDSNCQWDNWNELQHRRKAFEEVQQELSDIYRHQFGANYFGEQ